MIDSNIFIL